MIDFGLSLRRRTCSFAHRVTIRVQERRDVSKVRSIMIYNDPPIKYNASFVQARNIFKSTNCAIMFPSSLSFIHDRTDKRLNQELGSVLSTTMSAQIPSFAGKSAAILTIVCDFNHIYHSSILRTPSRRSSIIIVRDLNHVYHSSVLRTPSLRCSVVVVCNLNHVDYSSVFRTPSLCRVVYSVLSSIEIKCAYDCRTDHYSQSQPYQLQQYPRLSQSELRWRG